MKRTFRALRRSLAHESTRLLERTVCKEMQIQLSSHPYLEELVNRLDLQTVEKSAIKFSHLFSKDIKCL